MKPALPAALGILLAFAAANIGATAAEEENLAKLAAEYNAKVENEGDEVVCRMVSKVGSRIKERQCRTRAQIKQDEDEARRFASKHKRVTTQAR